MFRIPELPHSRIRQPAQCASAGRPPVGHQNWFPNDQHAPLPFRMLNEKLVGCGGPPQTKRSSGGQQQNQAGHGRIRIKYILELSNICSGKRYEWLLVRRHGPRSPQVNREEQNGHRHDAENNEFLFHFADCQKPPAMSPATCCGKRSIPRTTITAAQSMTLAINLPRTAHCLARRCCQNPRPMSTTESPRSHGRNVAKKALAVPAPRAAANPNGRQQLIDASELSSAPADAKTPEPVFTVFLLFGPHGPHGESFREAVDPQLSIQRTTGSSARSLAPVTILRPRLARRCELSESP